MYQFIVKPLEFFYGIWPNYAGAIALLTLTIMLVLLPLTLKGTRSMLAMQKLQPELKKIQSKYRDDRQQLNEEMMKFYKENNINPMAGCLPLLLQMPVFFVLYRVIYDLLHRAPYGYDMGAAAAAAMNDGSSFQSFGNFDPKHISHSSQLWQDLHGTNEMSSFGINLADSATKAFGSGLGRAWPYILLVLVVAGTSYYQQRQIAGRTDQSNVNPQQQMLMKIMPLFFSVISLTLPAGIVVYFLVSNLFRIGQQAFITRTMYKDSDGHLIQTTGRDATGGSGERRSAWQQFKEIAPNPAKAKAEAASPKANSAKSGTKTATKPRPGAAKKPANSSSPAPKNKNTNTSGSARSGAGAKPSRTAPTNANRSKTKKKRK